MSKFSDYLKRHIEARGESVLSIARNTGIERTSLQRALKGEKVLSSKTVHTLAIYLQLSLEERREYFRLYNMLLQGEDMWHNQAAVCELLNQLSSTQFLPDASEQSLFKANENFIPSFEYKMIEGEYPTRNTLSTILTWEVCQDSRAHFKMFLPFEMDFASILLKLWNNGARFTTDHLFVSPPVTVMTAHKASKYLSRLSRCVSPHGIFITLTTFMISRRPCWQIR